MVAFLPVPGHWVEFLQLALGYFELWSGGARCHTTILGGGGSWFSRYSLA